VRPKRLILVIEQDPVVLSCRMMALSVNGYRVVGVHNLEQAKQAMREHPVDAIHVRQRIANDFCVPVIVSDKISETISKLKIMLWHNPHKDNPSQSPSQP
jgi:DNA-binding NtrC family response regulator